MRFSGEDGDAVPCLKILFCQLGCTPFPQVAFDTSKHLSESALKRRSMERMKLQELERQREEQKRREKEEEERRKEEERYCGPERENVWNHD